MTSHSPTPPRKTGPKVPKGWRRLKAGEEIKSTDMLWIWNKGPWTRQGDTDAPSTGQFYRPFGNTIDSAGHHWLNIRRQPRQRRK